MKSLRKLIPAVCLLLISALLLGTSTFAWFSINTSVSATGMKIKAKNANGTLLIDAQKYKADHTKEATPTYGSIQSAKQTSVDLSLATYNYTDDFNFKPCAHGTENINTPAGWFYKVGDAANSYASTKTSTYLSKFDGFVLYYDLYFTVAEDSAAMSDLKVKSVTIKATSGSAITDAARVLVMTDDGKTSEEFYNAHTEGTASIAAHTTGDTVFASTITDTTLVHLRVFIYIDGEDASIFTWNAPNLVETPISIEFSASQPTES